MAEDRRIALAALAVTAIVGIAGPFGTVIVTNNHDDNRARAERVDADRVELRAVLEETARVLTVAGARFHGVRPTRRISDANARTQIDQVKTQIPSIQQQYNRVAIRLGREAPVAQQLFRALEAAAALGPRIDALVRRTRRDLVGGFDNAVARYNVALRRYARARKKFVDAAHRVARSTLE